MYTLDIIREKKRILGLSNETLSARSGVPLSTVQKVMAGVTKNPREKTLKALSDALMNAESPNNESSSYYYPDFSELDDGYQVKDSMAAAYQTKKFYTMEDIKALPDDLRVELIDGILYFMGQPSRIHQKIIGELYLDIAGHIRSRNGPCEVYLSPFGVDLFDDQTVILIPDLTVICDIDKLDEDGCHGAPDWVIEVVSPSSKKRDNVIKLEKYRKAGVREYWIIYPDKRMLFVHLFNDGDEDVFLYSFEDLVPCSLYPELKIRLADHV